LAGILLLVLSLALGFIAYHDNELRKRTGRVNPGYLSSYSEVDSYEINPETILTSISKNEPSIFSPMVEDIGSIEPLAGSHFNFTQNDYLQIASALGKFVWNDPMNLDDWSIYWLLFEGECESEPTGFYLASIIYFKPIETNGRSAYTTRLVEIYPYLGLVQTGSGAKYPIPILSSWKKVNLVDAITADEAVQIADENGGKEARLQADSNLCSIYIHSPNYGKNDKWYVSYFGTGFEMYVPMKEVNFPW
jgi:hypothetical protein